MSARPQFKEKPNEPKREAPELKLVVDNTRTEGSPYKGLTPEELFAKLQSHIQIRDAGWRGAEFDQGYIDALWEEAKARGFTDKDYGRFLNRKSGSE